MSKSAILAFITFLTNNQSEQVIAFCLLRELAEPPPVDIYWYQKGQALLSSTDERRNCFSWTCIGSAENIDVLRNKLLEGADLTDFNENKFRIKFASDSLNSTSTMSELDIYLVDGNRPLSSEHLREYYTIKNWNIDIGPNITTIIDEKISDAIVGYRQDLKNPPKSMDPPGLLGKKYLHKYLHDGIVFVREPLGIDMDFSGQPNGRGNEPITGFRGCADNLPSDFNPLRLQIFDENVDLAGETLVYSNQGWAEWNIECVKHGITKGSIRLLNSKDDILGWEKFYLLTQISTNIDIQHTVVTDLYGRNLSMGSRKESVPAPAKIIWQPSFKENPVDLSDKISDVIASLSPSILVNDPYGFGKLKAANQTVTNLSTIDVNSGTQCFINALIVAMTKTKIREIQILCDPVRLGKNAEEIESQIELYKILFGDLKKLDIEKVTIGLSKSRFHDRYYLGLASKDNGHNILFKSTKSIGGLLTTDDLEIEESHDNRAQVAKILDRWKDSNKRTILG